ncbi:MAG TPA: hypothetical protein VG326_18385 [Tepidisphaeraceae bacterium]|nr:hypothetical protein [Tepidisphaeraceae bacterium]
MPILILAALISCGGCNRKRNLSDIPILPNLTMDEYEDQVGAPSRIGNSNHWIAYRLKGGGELRLFFLSGRPGTPRTLTNAIVFNDAGNVVKHVYDLPTATHPASTAPAEAPTTEDSAKSKPSADEPKTNLK